MCVARARAVQASNLFDSEDMPKPLKPPSSLALSQPLSYLTRLVSYRIDLPMKKIFSGSRRSKTPATFGEQARAADGLPALSHQQNGRSVLCETAQFGAHCKN